MMMASMVSRHLVETAAATTEGAVAALHRVHCRSLVRLAVLLLDDVGAALHTALGGTR